MASEGNIKPWVYFKYELADYYITKFPFKDKEKKWTMNFKTPFRTHYFSSSSIEWKGKRKLDIAVYGLIQK